MPIPTPGRGGRTQGCYRCGAAKTDIAMQLQARPLVKREAGVNPYGPSTNRQRSFCQSCADEVWDLAFAVLDDARARS